jgi:hypothetical protein
MKRSVMAVTAGFVTIVVLAMGTDLALRALLSGRPMRHALILGALGLAFDDARTIATWETAPAWFHLLALVLPAAWLDGTIRERQLARRGGAGRLAAA